MKRIKEGQLLFFCLILIAAHSSECTENGRCRHLFFTDVKREEIFRMPTCGGQQEPMNLSAKVPTSPYAITYDTHQNYIYWTTRGRKFEEIGRMAVENGEVEVMALSAASYPEGIAADPNTGLLYVTDYRLEIIQVINFKEKTNRTIISDKLANPRAIALDHESGYIYWTDWGSVPHIGKASIDGKDQVLLVTTDLIWPNGLALDRENSRLYFCDGHPNKSSIQSVNTNGMDRQIHFRDNNGLYNFLGIAVDDWFIYVTSWTQSLLLHLPKDAIDMTGRLHSPGETVAAWDSTGIRNMVVVNNPSKLSATAKPAKGNDGKCTTASIPLDSEGKILVSKYVFLSLLAVPIICILLAVFCFKRGKGVKSRERRPGHQQEADDYYEDIDKINMRSLSAQNQTDRTRI